MNSPNRIIPSFLSNLLCVLPNIKHKIVTIIIKPKSTIIFEFTGIGVMVLLKPSTNKILNIFESYIIQTHSEYEHQYRFFV